MPVPCEVGEVLTHLPTRREASQVVRLSGESPTSPLASLRWRTAFSAFDDEGASPAQHPAVERRRFVARSLAECTESST